MLVLSAVRMRVDEVAVPMLMLPLRRALRGGPLPNPDEFVPVSHEMLDALNEAGPMSTPRRTP